MNTPNDASDSQITRLLDGDPAKAFEPASILARPQKARPEHPLAKELYVKFRAGSATLTKDQAWEIANELDALLATQLELQQEMTDKFAEARATVARLVAEIQELRGDHEAPPPRTELVDLGRSDQPPESRPVRCDHDEADGWDRGDPTP